MGATFFEFLCNVILECIYASGFFGSSMALLISRSVFSVKKRCIQLEKG